MLIERDDFQGAEARQKKIYLVDLRRTDADGSLEKRLVLDLLNIEDPGGVSTPARPGEFGVGAGVLVPAAVGGEPRGPRPVDAADRQRQQLPRQSNGRWTARDRPDDTELIVVDVPALR